MTDSSIYRTFRTASMRALQIVFIFVDGLKYQGIGQICIPYQGSTDIRPLFLRAWIDARRGIQDIETELTQGRTRSTLEGVIPD